LSAQKTATVLAHDEAALGLRVVRVGLGQLLADFQGAIQFEGIME